MVAYRPVVFVVSYPVGITTRKLTITAATTAVFFAIMLLIGHLSWAKALLATAGFLVLALLRDWLLLRWRMRGLESVPAADEARDHDETSV